MKANFELFYRSNNKKPWSKRITIYQENTSLYLLKFVMMKTWSYYLSWSVESAFELVRVSDELDCTEDYFVFDRGYLDRNSWELRVQIQKRRY